MPRRAGPPWHWAWWWERWTWDFEEAESCRGWSEASRTESANQREIMHKIDLHCTRRGLVQLWKIQVSMDHYSLFKCLRVLVPRGKSSRIWLIPSRSQVFFCFFFCAAPFPGGSVIMSSCTRSTHTSSSLSCTRHGNTTMSLYQARPPLQVSPCSWTSLPNSFHFLLEPE